MWSKEEQEKKADHGTGTMKKAAGDLTHNQELHGAGDADVAERSDEERASPTRLAGIPGHGMTSNMPDDA